MLPLTIFTPAYNRAYCLTKLYESLTQQTNQRFEWLIVDDGSTDETPDIVKQFISENRITVRYIRQNNGGKHRAINRGVQNARGQLFFIVDSDDYLTPDAVEWILCTASLIDGDERFAGISGTRIRPDGCRIGGGTDFGTIDANAIDIRLTHHIAGDLAEVYRTDVLRRYPFPEFEGEKFCPEALVWNRIANTYLLRYVHKGIYICEYLPDGLTARITILRHRAPKASMTYYSELYHSDIPIIQRIKAAINFWRFADKTNPRTFNMFNPLSVCALLPGLIMRLKDYTKK